MLDLVFDHDGIKLRFLLRLLRGLVLLLSAHIVWEALLPLAPFVSDEVELRA